MVASCFLSVNEGWGEENEEEVVVEGEDEGEEWIREEEGPADSLHSL